MKAAIQEVESPDRQPAANGGGRRFKPIQAVARASSVLKAFGAARGELGIGEIAHRVQLSPSTVYRLVATLCETGLLERNPVSGKYYPGLDLFILAQTAIPQQIIARESSGALESLAKAVGEAAILGCRQGDRVVVLHHVAVAKVLCVDLQSGETLPAATSALGRVLLAADLTAADDSAERERIRRDGYAVDREECFPGVSSLAAPIRDFRGEVVAALAVSGPSSRLTAGRLAEVQPLVVAAADTVSRRLGRERQPYRAPPTRTSHPV